MSRFQVDSVQVTQAGTTVQASAERIQAEVDAMMRHLLALQSSWQGQASSSFQSLAGQWRMTQERVRTSLEEIRQALLLAGRQYEDAEAQATRMFSA